MALMTAAVARAMPAGIIEILLAIGEPIGHYNAVATYRNRAFVAARLPPTLQSRLQNLVNSHILELIFKVLIQVYISTRTHPGRFVPLPIQMPPACIQRHSYFFFNYWWR
jgi:hypothetical protein